MKRHPGLQCLSREHHQALVLARALQPDTPAALRGRLPGEPEAMVTEVRRRWEKDLAPHFLLEERELVPLSLCGAAPLPEQAEAILAQHRQLREGFARLFEGPAGRTPVQRDRLGKLLAEHVRFEEKTWFPTLEASLDPPVLRELGFCLQTVPEVEVVGFERDDDGVFVARLACGHGRHVRHDPPFREAAWVTTAEGRAENLGVRFACPLCRMPRLPACAQAYRESPPYDSTSVPAGLLSSHRLRAGTWGRIVVLAGHVQYVLEDEEDHTLVLRPGVDGIVAPERPHRIALDQQAKLKILFYRGRPG